MSAAIHFAAKRLVAAIAPAPGVHVTVQRSVQLAEALQAVIKAHLAATAEDHGSVATEGMVMGLATTIGWLVSMQPPELQEAGMSLLFEQATIATKGCNLWRAPAQGGTQ
jgi:hypothetical protein